ncbi:MAG: hypothetical protein ABI806_13295 [Candidatus Solibacter sp.]
MCKYSGSIAKSLFALVLCAGSSQAQVNVLTANGSNDRTNANLEEIELSPATVNGGAFGKLGTLQVDGQVYAQPLYVSQLPMPGQGTRNVLFIATMNNSVYAFDADALSPVSVLWRVNLGTPVPATVLFGPNGDISNDVGILSTGTIDLQRGVLYVVSEVYDRGLPLFHLHALDLATGAERMNGPVAITGAVPGIGAGALPDGTLPFVSPQHIQRPGLLLANNSVYVSFGSHGDQYPYHGWMLKYDASDLTRQPGAFVSTPDGSGGAFWQSGRGPAADRQGNIYAVTGNGDYDATRNFSQSFIKLSPGGPALLDFFTPKDWQVMSQNDFDLSGPALVSGTHTMVGSDKLGNLYVLDGDAMRSPTGSSVIAAHDGSIFTFALWSRGEDAYVYTRARGEPLKCFAINGKTIYPEPVSSGSELVQYSRTGMTLSANGGLDGSGILWQSTGNFSDPNAPGVLNAYDASDLSRELWSSEFNPARDRLPPVAKFVPPTVANGKVYVASSSKVVTVYGLFSPPEIERIVPVISNLANAASYSQDGISPGELVSVFGSNLGPSTAAGTEVDGSGWISTTLAGTQVLFDGIPAPMIYASASQVSAIVPFGITGATTKVQVRYQNEPSELVPVAVLPASPGIFSAGGSGSGQALAQNQEGTFNSAENAATPGSVITLWLTGVGQLSPPGLDGAWTGATELPVPLLPLVAWIGSQKAEVLYAGGAPGMAQGIIQVNLRIPASSDTGPAVPLSVTVGDSGSQAGLTLAIRPI